MLFWVREIYFLGELEQSVVLNAGVCAQGKLSPFILPQSVQRPDFIIVPAFCRFKCEDLAQIGYIFLIGVPPHEVCFVSVFIL